MLKLQWLNCLWLMIPILAWNAAFSSKLAHPAFKFDEAVPKRILMLENVLRGSVTILPLFMPLRWDTPQSKIGIAVYLVGLVVYFASWAPLMIKPASAWSNSLLGFLAPAYTPLLWLVGIMLISGWWPYLVLSLAFVGVHISHWEQIFTLVMKK
ncbi:MAG: hypothetical protein NWE83_03905 [Candidatus Bathyarchaeota archaeon]|nr:hypothetical protein [Candidatus Bathyarchaeota archaeon]